MHAIKQQFETVSKVKYRRINTKRDKLINFTTLANSHIEHTKKSRERIFFKNFHE
jgi:uncharacterized membrane protein